jgi:hypothetical protein
VAGFLRVLGPKRHEVRGDWRKLHNGELHNLISSPNIIRMIKSRRMKWAGHVVRLGETRNTHRILVGKPKETTRKIKITSVDNIKMDLKRDRMRWYGLDRTGSG